MPTITAIQTGRPKRLDRDGDPWTSAIFKEPVSGPILLRRVNLEGDEQADLRVHGGPDKAVCVYSGDHYPVWREHFPRMQPGAFGENFTVADCTEATVCIGDIYQAGDAMVQVSQPRQPCWKLGRKWDAEELPALVAKSGRTGWYFRVLTEGSVAAGDPLLLTKRLYPTLTLTRLNIAMYVRGEDTPWNDLKELAACPELSRSWRDAFTRRLGAGYTL